MKCGKCGGSVVVPSEAVVSKIGSKECGNHSIVIPLLVCPRCRHFKVNLSASAYESMAAINLSHGTLEVGDETREGPPKPGAIEAVIWIGCTALCTAAAVVVSWGATSYAAMIVGLAFATAGSYVGKELARSYNERRTNRARRKGK